MNAYSVLAIYKAELTRCREEMLAGFLVPVVSAALYLIVFGPLNPGARPVGGDDYSIFILPGLIMLSLIMETVFTAAISLFLPKETHVIYEILAARLSPAEIVLGYGGAAFTKALLLGAVLLGAARLFVPYSVLHPAWMVFALMATSAMFSIVGLILGIWASGVRKLVAVPSLILSPLIFLSGGFYSIDSLPPFWKDLTLANPFVYVIAAFRWSFSGNSFVDIRYCGLIMIAFVLIGYATLWGMVTTGYRWKS